jgi:hypothetical protein
VFAPAAWPTLRSTHLEPPLAAVAGERLGLGATASDAAVVTALSSPTAHDDPAGGRAEL